VILLQNHVHHVQPIVAIVLQPHSVGMEHAIQMKPVTRVQVIVLVHVHAPMEKSEMIQMSA